MAKILIIGGGIIGSSLAWQLAKAVLSNDLIVVEPDPSYEYVATPRAVGGILFFQGLLENLLPHFDFDDVKISLYSPRDVRIDPHSALHGYRKSALELRVQYKQDKVTGINHNKSKIESINLESGETISVELVVNGANCWASGIWELVGMKVSVAPVRRQTFFFDMQQEIGFCPDIRDYNGLSFRPDASSFIASKTAAGGETGFNWNLNHLEFEQELWPLMACRSKAFEAIKYKGVRVGNYD